LIFVLVKIFFEININFKRFLEVAEKRERLRAERDKKNSGK